MKKIIKHVILLIIAAFTLWKANAQVNIPDPNFKQFLTNNYPTVINGGGQLDTIAASTIIGNFNCDHQNISDLEGVQYFKSIQRLLARSNNLSGLPDLKRLTSNLTELRVDTNNFTTLPDITYLINLKVVTCRENKLTTITKLSGLTQLQTFFCDNNQLTSLPDLTGLVNLNHVIISDNPFTSLPSFDDLVSLNRILCQRTNLTSFPNLNNCTNLQDLMIDHNKLTSLPDLSNCTALQNLHCEYNQLTTIPSLSTCNALINFYCYNNQLTSLPDISNCTALQNFFCNSNKITSLPDVNNCTSLKKLVFDNNQISTFPNISALTNLTDICAQDNLLETIPDLSTYTLLNYAKFYNNFLSFEDFVPSMSNPVFNIFEINPQSPGTIKTLNTFEKDSLEIDLGFDNSISTNIYKWYRNNVLITSTSTNKLKIKPVSMSDAGVYTCIVTSTLPALSGDTLFSQAITVVIAPCIITNNLVIDVLNNECHYPIEINVNESTIIGGKKPFSYTLTNAITNQQQIFLIPNFSTSQEGFYHLTIKDVNGCEATVQNIDISRNEKCDPVFYPNGDGIADTYFVEQKGLVKIYNRSGQLIKDFTGPEYWDGKTNKGEDAESGLYAIIINDKESIRVYLIR